MGMTWFAFLFLIICAVVLGFLVVHLVRVHRRLKLRHQKPSTHDAPSGLEGQLELSFVLAYGVDTYNSLLREHERIQAREERRERRRREQEAARRRRGRGDEENPTTPECEDHDSTAASFPPRPPTPIPNPIAPPPPAHTIATATREPEFQPPPPLGSTSVTVPIEPYDPIHARLTRSASQSSQLSRRSNTSTATDELSIHSTVLGNSQASSFRGPLPPYSEQPQEGDIGYGWRVVGEVPRGGLSTSAAAAATTPNAPLPSTATEDEQDDALAQMGGGSGTRSPQHPRDTRIIFAPPALTGRTHRRPAASRLVRALNGERQGRQRNNAPQFNLPASPYPNVSSEVRESFHGVMRTMMARIQLDAQQGSWPPLYVYQPPMDPTQIQQALIQTDNSPNVTAPGLRRPSLAPPGTERRRMSLFSITSTTSTTAATVPPPLPPPPSFPSPLSLPSSTSSAPATTTITITTENIDAVAADTSVTVPIPGNNTGTDNHNSSAAVAVVVDSC